MAKLDRFIIDDTTYELVPEIAPLFNSATSYSVGDCVIHDAVLYKFTANHAAGAWTGNDVVAFEVGSELVRLGSGASGSGLTEDVKVALLACFEKVAWIDEGGQDYYDALYDALYPPTDLVSISAVYTQSGTVYTNDTLNSLRNNLVVTAHMSDSTTQTVTSYALSGTLVKGTSTITVSYSGKTTTFNVIVSEPWEYHISDLTKATGTFTSNSNANCGMALQTSGGAAVRRRSFAVGNGETSVALVASSATGVPYQQTSDYYPIKIPQGATSVTVDITPSTQYVQILARVLENGVYSAFTTTTGWSGYQEGGGTKTFETAPDNAYIFVTTKYDNAGSSYPTEPTGLDVTFE